jgi:uncharacterized protein
MKVTGLHRYPVKSLRGTSLTHATVERLGLQGDRRWMVVDPAGKFQTIREHPVMTQIEATTRNDGGLTLAHPQHGNVTVAIPAASVSTRSVRIWRDDVAASPAAAAAGEFLSKVLGVPAELVYLAKPDARPVDPTFGQPGDTTSFADGFPVLITNTMSLNDLNSRLTGTGSGKVEMRRFRPNVVISGARPWLEDTWKAIRIGNVTFRVAKPCARCVVTTRDPDTGVQLDPREPLKTLGSFHRAANGGIIFGQNLIPDTIGEIRVGDSVEVLSEGASNLK